MSRRPARPGSCAWGAPPGGSWVGGSNVGGGENLSSRVSRMPVPLFDTKTPLEPLQAAIRERIEAVLADGRFILGPEVEAFERELADYLGAKHAVGVGNGTDAITLALRALGVGPGDEVVVPSFTFYASPEA